MSRMWGADSLPGIRHYRGEVVSRDELHKAVQQQVKYNYFGAPGEHFGMYHVLKDFERTIKNRWRAMSAIDKRNLWLISAGSTLLCAMGAAFIAGLPDSYGSEMNVFGWELDINWVIDPVANALFIVTLLPMLKLALRNRYADYVEGRGTSEHDVLLGAVDLEGNVGSVKPAETPQYNIQQWAGVKDELRRIHNINNSHDAMVKQNWDDRTEITRDNLPAYVKMNCSRAYNTGLTKVAILTFLPYLMAKMPGASDETTGSYKGVNFLWEVLVGFAILMLHGRIRDYVVKPLSSLAGNAAYGAVAVARAIGGSPFCCLLPEDAPRTSERQRRSDMADSVLEVLAEAPDRDSKYGVTGELSASAVEMQGYQVTTAAGRAKDDMSIYDDLGDRSSTPTPTPRATGAFKF